MSDELIIAVIGAGVSLVTLFVNIKIKKTVIHVKEQINSRMDELLALTKSASKAEGKIEEKYEEKERQKGHTQN